MYGRRSEEDPQAARKYNYTNRACTTHMLVHNK
uniref:Uncharacterized protein n=1 Tax=Parascaris equorum TaxID=6256 RepID=A0A914R769_PAREQ